MKKRLLFMVLTAAALALPALSQTAPLPLPPQVEKDLAARVARAWDHIQRGHFFADLSLAESRDRVAQMGDPDMSWIYST